MSADFFKSLPNIPLQRESHKIGHLSKPAILLVQVQTEKCSEASCVKQIVIFTNNYIGIDFYVLCKKVCSCKEIVNQSVLRFKRAQLP
jgi:hypothetical protein